LELPSYIVACRAVTRQQARDEQIYQSHYWVTRFANKICSHRNNLSNNRKAVFSVGQSPDIITETSLELSSVVGYVPDSKDISRHKDFMCTVVTVIFAVCNSVGLLQLLCSNLLPGND
jgi:hypothetical protein